MQGRGSRACLSLSHSHKLYKNPSHSHVPQSVPGCAQCRARLAVGLFGLGPAVRLSPCACACTCTRVAVTVVTGPRESHIKLCTFYASGSAGRTGPPDHRTAGLEQFHRNFRPASAVCRRPFQTAAAPSLSGNCSLRSAARARYLMGVLPPEFGVLVWGHRYRPTVVFPGRVPRRAQGSKGASC